MEELRTSNLERECNEEVCDVQEAFEIFEDMPKAKAFILARNTQCQILDPCWKNGQSVSTIFLKIIINIYGDSSLLALLIQNNRVDQILNLDTCFIIFDC